MTRLHLCFATIAFAFASNSAAAEAGQPAPRPNAPSISLDREAVRAKLAERRARTVKHFLAYRDARVYPINELPGGGFRHVWIDRDGNLCAAATLISKDWGRDAAIRVGKGNTEIKLADVKSGPVLDWMLTSGMTRAELVAIQLPGGVFMPDRRQQEIQRMNQIYVDVERQIRSLWDANLDVATDELMKHPRLARELVSDPVMGRGTFAKPPVG